MIEIHGVYKRYSRSDGVLCGVDLAVGDSEIVLLSGPTSTGKTTLLRLLYAAHQPDSGTVQVFGRDLARLRRSSIAILRRRLGVVPQTLALLDERTAFANVALALEVRAEAAHMIRMRAAEVLGTLGLGEYLDAPVCELSLGQRQLVAVARAIIADPAVLIADEPSAHLDDDGRKTLIEHLVRMQHSGLTAVIATNDHKLLSVGARYGWQHYELKGGTLHKVEARRERLATLPPVTDAESNIVPFPLALTAEGKRSAGGIS